VKKSRAIDTLSNDQLQSMTTEELQTLTKKYKADIATFKRPHFKKKLLEMEYCYIQRELEFRLSWPKFERETLKFARA